MEIKFAFVRSEGSDELEEYVRAELRKRVLQDYIKTRIKQKMPQAYLKGGEMLMTFSASESNHTASCALREVNGDIMHQIVQTSPNLYMAIDNVINKLSVRLKSVKTKIPDFKFNFQGRTIVRNGFAENKNHILKGTYGGYKSL